jgi:hypothetical protein
VNCVERSSLVVALQNFTLHGGSPLSLVTVSGERIEESRVVTAWTDENGKKWYAYDFGGVSGGRVFASSNDAARAGCSPWLE